MLEWKKLTTQIKKMRISQRRNRFSKFRNWTKRNQNWFKKNTNDQEMKIVYQRQETSIISEIHQLQSKIHQRLLQQSNIFDQLYNKKQILIMKKKTKRIQSITVNMHYKLSIQDVRYKEISTIENRRIRFNYRNLHQSEIRWQVTFNNLFFKKTFVSRTELRYSRQEIISNRNLFKTMKSIRRKSVRIYHIHESQEFLAFYHDKAIQ